MITKNRKVETSAAHLISPISNQDIKGTFNLQHVLMLFLLQII